MYWDKLKASTSWSIYAPWQPPLNCIISLQASSIYWYFACTVKNVIPALKIFFRWRNVIILIFCSWSLIETKALVYMYSKVLIRKRFLKRTLYQGDPYIFFFLIFSPSKHPWLLIFIKLTFLLNIFQSQQFSFLLNWSLMAC